MHTDESSQAIQSPIVVGIASLIPGLGFWLLGQRNRAIVTVTVVVGLGVLSILFREQPVSVLMAGTSGLAWLAQIIFSVQVATGLYHRSLGKMAPPREVNTRLFRRPSSLLSRHEANVLLGRNIAFQQLAPGERLLKAAIARTRIPFGWLLLAGPASFFAQSWYCLAMTQNGLILVQLDFLWKPLGLERLAFGEIEEARFELGWQTDRLRLRFSDGEKLDFEVVHVFREEVQAMASVFNRNLEQHRSQTEDAG